MKNKQLLILLASTLFFMFVLNVSIAMNEIVTTPAQDSHTSVSSSYCGETKTVPFSITNNNEGGLLCWYYTSQDATKRLLTPSCVRPGTTQSQLLVQVRTPTTGSSPSTVIVQLQCFDFYSVFGGDLCNNAYASSYDLARQNMYSCAGAHGEAGCDAEMAPRYLDTSCSAWCGDGITNGNEKCDGNSKPSCQSLGFSSGSTSCTGSCQNVGTSNCIKCNNVCSSGSKQCSGTGYTECTTDSNGCYIWSTVRSCGVDTACSPSNGQCVSLTTDENCGAIGNRCDFSQECVNKQCKSKCGNGRIDSGETCKTCSQDVRCGSNEVCGNLGQCVSLGTNENCAALDDRCGNGFCVSRVCVECKNTDDCRGKTQDEPSGEYKCSSDYRSRIPILNRKGGECVSNKCTGSIKTDGTSESCGGKPCQQTSGSNDAQCGCLSGYSEAKGQCLKMKELELNAPCEDDFRCISNFCYKGTCANGIKPTIKVSKTLAQQGEEVDVSISLVNELNDDIQAQLILEPGSGVTVTRSDGAQICNSAQCSNYDLVSGRNSKSINLQVLGEESKVVNLKGQIKYDFEGKSHYVPLNEVITFVKCGNGKVEEGETAQNCCIDVSCQPDTSFYSYECNQNTKSCDKKIHSYLYLGVLGIIVLLIAIWFIVAKVSGRNKDIKDMKRHGVYKPDARKTKKLEKFIDHEIKTKEPKEKIKKELKDAGWDKEVVEEAVEKEEKKLKKFCQECGAKTKGKGKFCHKCGEKL